VDKRKKGFKMKIGITGQAGFIGTHLYNNLGLDDSFERIPFADEFFQSEEVLDKFVAQCEVIVHLAAMNRHNDPQVLYKTNIELVEKLINSVKRCMTSPHIIMSSSTQEERDNLYGRSKREGREKFVEFAKAGGCFFTGLVIPNVYGPFGNPFYNSVTSTFSHLIANDKEVKIDIDAELEMIYVQDLCQEIIKAIKENKYADEVPLGNTGTCKVSELRDKLQAFQDTYSKGIIPKFNNRFDLTLFNTYRCYLPKEHFPVLYTKHTDNRGSFVEIIKSNGEGQFSFSTTKPGITRGNHYHTRKVERFAVISGKASIKLRKIGTHEIIEYIIDGNEPGFVDMPIWFTHNITNIGDEELITLFWINEFYDQEDPDTFYEEV